MNEKIKQNQMKLIYLTLLNLECQSSDGFALPFSTLFGIHTFKSLNIYFRLHSMAKFASLDYQLMIRSIVCLLPDPQIPSDFITFKIPFFNIYIQSNSH